MRKGTPDKSPRRGIFSWLTTRSTFDVGPWNFSFAHNVEGETRQRIRELFQGAYPHIEALVGSPSESGAGKWKIKPSSSEGDFSRESTIRRELLLAPNSTDALSVHEFAHVFQGTDFPEVSWIREGTAVAVSNLVAQRMGIPRWDAEMPKLPKLGMNVEKYLGIHPKGRYEYYGPLMKLRYRFAGRFWEDLEKSQPGAMKTFFEKVRKNYEEDSKEEVEEGIAATSAQRLLRGILGNLPNTYGRYRTLLEPAISSQPHADLTYAYSDRKNGEAIIKFHAVRRTPNTAEVILSPRPCEIEITNLRNGLRLLLPFRTSGHGSDILSLAGLAGKIGTAKVYDGKVMAEGCKSEKLVFSLQGNE